MIARSRAVIEAGGVLRTLAAQPPLTLRRIQHDDPDVCALCLVNSAAGPLASDEIDLDLVVDDGARVELSAAGAAIAQGRSRAMQADQRPPRPATPHLPRPATPHLPRPATPRPPRPADERATLRSTVQVGEHADLHAVCAPLIAAHGGLVDVSVEIRLAAAAAVHWQELLVLGRTGEPAGRLTMSWNVTRAGRPVLRQFIDLTDPMLCAWPGMLARGRVLATAFVSAPTLCADALTASGPALDQPDPTAMLQVIDDHTVLATVLDVSAALAAARLGALLTTIELADPLMDGPVARLQR